MLNFCDFVQVYVFSTNHHLNEKKSMYFFYVFDKNALLTPDHVRQHRH